jgi:hypothetical protein
VFVGSEKEFLERSPKTRKYDVVWLDWLGPWRKSNVEMIKRLICEDHLNFSDHKSPPLLGMTLIENGENNSETILSRVNLPANFDSASKLRYMARVAGVPQLLNDLAGEQGYSLKPDLIMRVSDHIGQKKASTVSLYLFSVFNRSIDFDVWDTHIVNMTQDVTANLSSFQ